MYIGQWVALELSGERFVGYITQVGQYKSRMKVTQPKAYLNEMMTISEVTDDLEFLEYIDLGEITSDEKKFLIEMSLLFKDEKWFMELTDEVNSNGR